MGVVCVCFCSCACACVCVCVWSVLPSALIPFTTLGSHNRSCRGHTPHLWSNYLGTRPVLDARVSIPWCTSLTSPQSHHHSFRFLVGPAPSSARQPPSAATSCYILQPAAPSSQLPAPGSRLQCWQPTGRQLTFWGRGLALHELRQSIPAPGARRGGSEFLRVLVRSGLVWSAVAGWLTGVQGGSFPALGAGIKATHTLTPRPS